MFVPANHLVFAIFNLGGGEIILVLSLILILFGAKRLPDIARGFGDGIYRFRKDINDVTKDFNNEAHDAGQTLGGIYGKPAAQALTPDNQIAELYEPGVFERHKKAWLRFQKFLRWFQAIWRFLCGR